MRQLTVPRPGGPRRRAAAGPEVPVPLVRLSEADLRLSQPSDDIRGRIVVDKARYGIGTVEDLLIDPITRRVRLMIVRGSDILLGEKDPLIPIDAIRRGDDQYVYLGKSHESVAEAPGFDPVRAMDPHYLAAVYDWYGSLPYWHPQYVYPADWSQRLGDSMRRPRPRR